MRNARLDELQAGISPKRNQPWICIGRMMLKLKLQYFGHLTRRVNSLEKTMILGKIEGREEKGTTEDEMVGWHHQLSGHEFEKTGRWWSTGKPGVLQSMRLQRVRHDWATEKQHLLCFRLEKHFQSFFVKKKKIIYLFLTALGIHGCIMAFSSCEQGLLSRCGAWAPHCSGFSCGAQAIGVWASVVAVWRLSSCGTWA